MYPSMMKHYASPRFWFHFRLLPKEIQELADRGFGLMKENPRHASIRLKKLQHDVWSARVGLHYRALAREWKGGLMWFWIGHHSEYDKLLS